MSLTGVWNIVIATPFGEQTAALDLTEHDGTVDGTIRNDAESGPLVDPSLNGNRLIWKQSITKPVNLNVTFDVTFTGDTLAGTAKAGMFPASKVTGKRA